MNKFDFTRDLQLNMYYKKIFSFSVLFVLAHFVAAQTTTDTDESTSNTPVIEYSTVNLKYEIAEIRVSGADNYEDFAIIGYSGLALGDMVSVPGDEITNAVKRFVRQGLFSSVKIYADKLEDGKVWLHIALKERPRVSEVTYSGLKKGEIEDLEQRVGIVKGNQITPNISDRAKKLVEKYLQEKGFLNATANVYQRNDPEKAGYVIVEVEVDKKLKTKVNRLIITGNDALSQMKIDRAMKKTSEKGKWYNFFSSKKFIQEEYVKDKNLVIEKYNEIGYRDAYIVTDSVVPFDDKSVNIYLTVDEGKKYYFRNITWIGNTVYPYEILDATLSIKKGDIYNHKQLNERLESDDDAVGKLYRDRGYLFMRIDPVEVQIDNDSIDFEMRLFEGKPATINEIGIIGNTRVYEHVIRRELYTKPGQLYSQSDIVRSLGELSRMGHFDQEKVFQDIDIQPNQENGTVDINYVLETKGSDQVEFSAGIGGTGLVGSLGLKFSNFAIQNLFKPEMYRIVPQGEGQTFSINARTSGRQYTSVSLSFLEPWLGGKRPNSFSASIYFAHQSTYSDRVMNNLSSYYNPYLYGNSYSSYGYGNNYGYDYSNYLQNEFDPEKYIRTLGISIGYGKRLSWPDDYFTFYGELSYQRYMLSQWAYLGLPDGNYNSPSLNLVLSRNSVMNPIYPRSGSTFSLGLKLTPPYSLLNGKDYSNPDMPLAERYKFIEYHKWKFSAKTFTPLDKNQKLVLMARAEFGYLGHYNINARTPFETFYLGGDGMSGYSSSYTMGMEYIPMRGYDAGDPIVMPAGSTSSSTSSYLYNKYTFELRYPISLEQSATIYALTFVEAGNSFVNINDYNPFNLRRSAGVGVRIFLQMFGMLGIDWAYGFDKTNAGEPGGSHFHFVLGQEL